MSWSLWAQLERNWKNWREKEMGREEGGRGGRIGDNDEVRRGKQENEYVEGGIEVRRLKEGELKCDRQVLEKRERERERNEKRVDAEDGGTEAKLKKERA